MSTYKDIYVVINSDRRVLSCCRSCNRLVIPKKLQATDAFHGYDEVAKTFCMVSFKFRIQCIYNSEIGFKVLN